MLLCIITSDHVAKARMSQQYTSSGRDITTPEIMLVLMLMLTYELVLTITMYQG